MNNHEDKFETFSSFQSFSLGMREQSGHCMSLIFAKYKL